MMRGAAPIPRNTMEDNVRIISKYLASFPFNLRLLVLSDINGILLIINRARITVRIIRKIVDSVSCVNKLISA